MHPDYPRWQLGLQTLRSDPPPWKGRSRSDRFQRSTFQLSVYGWAPFAKSSIIGRYVDVSPRASSQFEGSIAPELHRRICRTFAKLARRFPPFHAIVTKEQPYLAAGFCSGDVNISSSLWANAAVIRTVTGTRTQGAFSSLDAYMRDLDDLHTATRTRTCHRMKRCYSRPGPGTQ